MEKRETERYRERLRTFEKHLANVDVHGGCCGREFCAQSPSTDVDCNGDGKCVKFVVIVSVVGVSEDAVGFVSIVDDND